MAGMTIRRRARLLAAALAAVTAMAIVASSAGATVLLTSLDTYKASIDVKLDVTEDSNWKGIKPGCFAPQEEFGNTYKLNIDSTPHSKSKIKAGVAVVSPASFGVTPNYGETGSFRQSGESSGWTLESQYPGGCGTDPAPPVPSWATAPTCKKISERVSANLGETSAADPDQDAGSVSDGVLFIMRTIKTKPNVNGASVGDSCYRTLHDVNPKGIDSEASILLRSTLITVPVPKLASKLAKIAKGSKSSHPSFTIPLRVSGTCQAMTMTPFTGWRDGWTDTPISQPHQALGNIDADPYKSTCTIAGKGRAIVRRVGPTVTTPFKIK